MEHVSQLAVNLALRRGIGGHQSSRGRTDEWLTPPPILKPLGRFDLDPCSPIVRPWPTADHHFTIEDDGLNQKWFGRVFLNPPYGTETSQWMAKMAVHGNGIALIFARTETTWFHKYAWNRASGMLFLAGRITFRKVDGTPGKANGGAPSVLIAYGAENVDALAASGIAGKLIRL
jgi:hypothetical protein